MPTGPCGYGGQDCGGNKGVTIFEKPGETGYSPKPSPREKDGDEREDIEGIVGEAEGIIVTPTAKDQLVDDLNGVAAFFQLLALMVDGP